MATYIAVIKPALEYASFIWSPLASSTSINKLQVMQNAVLRTATGCTQDTNIQHPHDETLILHISEHLQLHGSQYKQKNNIHHKHTTYFNTPRLKNTDFNNGRYPTNIPTDNHTITTTDINTNMRLDALKRYFPASLVTPLPNSEQINHPSSNHIYTKSTPNHIHHHYAPSVTFAHTSHHLFNCSHICTTLSPLDLLTDLGCIAGQMDGKAGWWITSRYIRFSPPC